MGLGSDGDEDVGYFLLRVTAACDAEPTWKIRSYHMMQLFRRVFGRYLKKLMSRLSHLEMVYLSTERVVDVQLFLWSG